MKFLKNTGNLLILGFVGCALAMLFLVYKSVNVHFDLAADGDYYYKELQFDDLLIAKHNADLLEGQFKFNHSQPKLVLSIPDSLSSHLEEGTIHFYCVSDSKNDTHQVIQKNETGEYYFNRATVAPGKNYVVKLSFKADNKEYYKEFTML